MKKITYDIEWNVERSHWWFSGRRRLLKFLISSLGIRRNSLVVDVGCGVGSNLAFLKSMGLRVIGIDSEMYSLSFAKTLSGGPLVNGDLLRLPIKSDSIDLMIATDIFEHIEEDVLGMKEIYRVLKRGGKAIITVPAFMFLWGIQDRVGMHKRRYTKKEFLKKIESERFTILKSSYFNFLLFFPILLTRRMIRLLGLKIESENRINFPVINFFLKVLFGLEPWLLRYVSSPFGVSIYCVAKK
jgi:SAM-dependent methyltransferase